MPTYVFLDESGDLGFDFARGASQNFIVTALMTKEPRIVERAVRKTIRWIKRKRRKHSGCLHAYTEDRQTKLKLLHMLAEVDCLVVVVRLNKHKVWTRLQDEKPVLYNYVANILLGRLVSDGYLDEDARVELIASKRETNKFLNLNFRDYMQRQVRHNHQVQLEISILTPHEHKALQAVDVLSWSVFRNLERGDDNYYSVVQHLVRISPLFP